MQSICSMQCAVSHSMYSILNTAIVLNNTRYRELLQTPVRLNKQTHWPAVTADQIKPLTDDRDSPFISAVRHQQTKSRSELVPLPWNDWNKPSTGERGEESQCFVNMTQKGQVATVGEEWGTDKPHFRKGDSYLAYVGKRETYGEAVKKSLKLQ